MTKEENHKCTGTGACGRCNSKVYGGAGGSGYIKDIKELNSNKHMTKEQLRDKFVKLIHNKTIRFEYPSDFENTMDFFWNEIEQIRKNDRERVVEKIKELKNSRILSIVSSRAGKMKTEGYHKAINEVLSIIKQENE